MPNSKIEVRIDQPYIMNIETYQTLTGAGDIKVVYRDPAGNIGSISGSVVSGDTTKMTVRVPGSVNGTAGEWIFQASAKFSGDTNSTTGDPIFVICRPLWYAPGV